MVRSQAVADMTIGRLAKAGRVGVETIRYYQRRGLLSEPDRTGGAGRGGVRRYAAADVRRLRFIRSAQAAGFTLDEIGRLLALDATHDRIAAHSLARQRIAALDRQIADLTEARDALLRLADHCGEGAPGPCPILDAFEPRTVTDHAPNVRERALKSH